MFKIFGFGGNTNPLENISNTDNKVNEAIPLGDPKVKFLEENIENQENLKSKKFDEIDWEEFSKQPLPHSESARFIKSALEGIEHQEASDKQHQGDEPRTQTKKGLQWSRYRQARNGLFGHPEKIKPSNTADLNPRHAASESHSDSKQPVIDQTSGPSNSEKDRTSSTDSHEDQYEIGKSEDLTPPDQSESLNDDSTTFASAASSLSSEDEDVFLSLSSSESDLSEENSTLENQVLYYQVLAESRNDEAFKDGYGLKKFFNKKQHISLCSDQKEIDEIAARFKGAPKKAEVLPVAKRQENPPIIEDKKEDDEIVQLINNFNKGPKEPNREEEEKAQLEKLDKSLKQVNGGNNVLAVANNDENENGGGGEEKSDDNSKRVGGNDENRANKRDTVKQSDSDIQKDSPVDGIDALKPSFKQTLRKMLPYIAIAFTLLAITGLLIAMHYIPTMNPTIPGLGLTVAQGIEFIGLPIFAATLVIAYIVKKHKPNNDSIIKA